MEKRKSIIKRLKKLRKDNNFTQAYVAKELFVSQSAYSLMEGGQNAVTADHILQLAKLYGVTADFLLTGNTNLIEMTAKNGFLPLIDAKAHAGFVKNAHKENVFDNFQFYRIPGYKPTEESVLIEIVGDSMLPTIISGDILICQTQKPDYVLDGSVAIIVTEGELLTTRLFKHHDNNYLRMESDNPNDESKDESKKEIKKSKILRLLLVIGKVSNAILPHKELVFKGKLKQLEDSVEFLNKEFYKMNKIIQSQMK